MIEMDKPVFFYEREFYVLSNFSAFRLYWKFIDFDTSEHVYHWEKFEGNAWVQVKIRDARSAHAVYKIAELHKMYVPQVAWNNQKVGIMREILIAKVQQHEYVRRKLMETGDRVLVENSWRDDFWGWGPNCTGQNMLGKLWMEIRSALRHENFPPYKDSLK